MEGCKYSPRPPPPPTQDETGNWHGTVHQVAVALDLFSKNEDTGTEMDAGFKGTVRRDLKGVKSGINR
jgi:hypothetical protein